MHAVCWPFLGLYGAQTYPKVSYRGLKAILGIKREEDFFLKATKLPKKSTFAYVRSQSLGGFSKQLERSTDRQARKFLVKNIKEARTDRAWKVKNMREAQTDRACRRRGWVQKTEPSEKTLYTGMKKWPVSNKRAAGQVGKTELSVKM